MQQKNIQAKMKKRFKRTTRVNYKAKAAPNLLQCNFTTKQPNQHWAADMAYVATAEGWLYVAVVFNSLKMGLVDTYK